MTAGVANGPRGDDSSPRQGAEDTTAAHANKPRNGFPVSAANIHAVDDPRSNQDTATWHILAPMNTTLPFRIVSAAACAAAALCCVTAYAQSSSGRPVRMIVGSAPAGPSDVQARLIVPKMSDVLGVSIIVDNRPSNNAIIGMEIGSKSPPDGHTFIIGNSGTHAVNATLYKSLPYDPINDFTHLTMLTSAPLLLVVGPNLQVTHLNELIGLARTRTLSYGSPGVGSGGHLSGELFRMMTSLQFTHVPYRGAGPAAIDVAAGNLDFQFASQITSQAFLQNGRLRVLAVTSLKRASSLPQVPSMNESGMVGIEVLNWFGISAPAHLSKPVTESFYK